MKYVYIIITAISIPIAIGSFVYNRSKEKKLLKRLNNMLDDAMNGDFSETIYDESMLASVETRLSQYLTSCTVSAKNLNAEKEKISELIADISHQTKTPIANIRLYTDLLEEQNLPAESKECVTALSQQVDKLSFLVGSLIKTSRLEVGIITPHPKENDICNMINSIIFQIEQKAKAKNIQITLQNTVEKAIYDEKWTTEALYNILDNAVKYTNKNGEIEITVIPYQLFCRIDIRDSGIGIAENEQSKIFKRFYRSPAINQSEGVGIGLYLAREIISSQGGYIKVESELGKGSQFSAFLPVNKSNLSKL